MYQSARGEWLAVIPADFLPVGINGEVAVSIWIWLLIGATLGLLVLWARSRIRKARDEVVLQEFREWSRDAGAPHMAKLARQIAALDEAPLDVAPKPAGLGSWMNNPVCRKCGHRHVLQTVISEIRTFHPVQYEDLKRSANWRTEFGCSKCGARVPLSGTRADLSSE
jgi:ribosomal protein L40E